MPTDISIDPGVSTVAAVQVKADAAPVAALPSGSPAAASPASPVLPNPRLTVDPGLNRVVLEFFDSSGTLTNQIPSQKQLDAYRLAAFSGQTVQADGASSEIGD